MRRAKKSGIGRVDKMPKHNPQPGDSPERVEQEAADFFAKNEEDSVRERYAYQTASKRALSRR